MDHLRRADAEVAHLTHPRHRSGMSRYNPKVRWNNRKRRWNAKKHGVVHPLEHQKMKARSKFNYFNPFYYLRRIKNNLKSVR